MKGMVKISEVEQKQRFLAELEPIQNERGMPLGIAMLWEGVYHLTQLGMREHSIRELFEKGLSHYTVASRRVRQPSREEIAKVLGGLREDE